jgi:hypothetical protein
MSEDLIECPECGRKVYYLDICEVCDEEMCTYCLEDHDCDD